MRRMVCFGDSNTYGYDAGSRLGRRLGEEERWPEILAARFGWETANEGMNGREIPEGWFCSALISLWTGNRRLLFWLSCLELMIFLIHFALTPAK